MEGEVIGPDRQLAWHVLGAVLRVTRDRLLLDQAAIFGSQMPLLVRGAYYDQFVRPACPTGSARSKNSWRAWAKNSRRAAVNVRDATRAVFGLLSRHLDQGAVAKVREALTEEIRVL